MPENVTFEISDMPMPSGPFTFGYDLLGYLHAALDDTQRNLLLPSCGTGSVGLDTGLFDTTNCTKQGNVPPVVPSSAMFTELGNCRSRSNFQARVFDGTHTLIPKGHSTTGYDSTAATNFVIPMGVAVAPRR